MITHRKLSDVWYADAMWQWKQVVGDTPPGSSMLSAVQEVAVLLTCHSFFTTIIAAHDQLQFDAREGYSAGASGGGIQSQETVTSIV